MFNQLIKDSGATGNCYHSKYFSTPSPKKKMNDNNNSNNKRVQEISKKKHHDIYMKQVCLSQTPKKSCKDIPSNDLHVQPE